MTRLNNKNKVVIINSKVYKYCWKCSGELIEGSKEPFCCWECKSEYYAENAREIDALWREIRGID